MVFMFFYKETTPEASVNEEPAQELHNTNHSLKN